MTVNRALALDRLKISKAQNERVGWRSTQVVGGHLKQVEVPEHLNTSWNNIRYMNHHEKKPGTTATNQQFNNSRYVFTSLARSSLARTRARESWPPAVPETIRMDPCDSKGYTHTHLPVLE